MSIGKKVICWDSCVFLAWLQDEKTEIGVMEGIEEVVRSINLGEAILLTSQMTNIEILQSRLTPKTQKKWKEIFNRKNCQIMDINPRVSEKANFIRDYYDQKDFKINIPDSIQLATAVIYHAEEFHTLDGAGKKRNNELLSLSGNVAGHKLKICVPYAQQGSLLTGVPPLAARKSN